MVMNFLVTEASRAACQAKPEPARLEGTSSGSGSGACGTLRPVGTCPGVHSRKTGTQFALISDCMCCNLSVCEWRTPTPHHPPLPWVHPASLAKPCSPAMHQLHPINPSWLLPVIAEGEKLLLQPVRKPSTAGLALPALPCLGLRACPAPHPPCPALLQGYVDAARVFERESGTAPGVDLDQITDRMNIRKAVQSGDVEQVGGGLGWAGQLCVQLWQAG